VIGPVSRAVKLGRHIDRKDRRKAMIPEIRKILYATDLSPNSAYAFRYAVNSAKQHDAKIIFLHVLERPSSLAIGMYAAHLGDKELRELFEDKAPQVRDLIQNRLKLFCDKELKDDPECADIVESIQVCEGYPAEEILGKADELDCDAIVMGSHGKGIIRNTFLGSTTLRVLRRARKPVFIIPLPEGEINITSHDH
jgi:nucleotide-binding universal stress UspA family protein